MDISNDISKIATCTSCRFVENKSNYWTAVLFFKHPNGSYIRVPQMANHNTGPGLQDGGMTVYYFQPPGNTRATAFPPGFRMIVGDPMRRSASGIPSNSPQMKATTFRCFQGNNIGNAVPGDSPDTFAFPSQPCSGGIRSNIYFPACWDGKNLDPPDHASHMAWPNGGFFGSSCPSSHPVRMPLLFLEIVWDTRPFNDRSLWPASGQPFIFSMGDPTGYGQHADYMFGWEGDALQRAMDTCTNQNGIPTDCRTLTVQGMNAMNQCKQHAKVPEEVEGTYLRELPGCNPIQSGPASATMIRECSAPSTVTNKPVQTIAVPIATPPWPVCGNGQLEPRCDSVPVTLTHPGSNPHITPIIIPPGPVAPTGAPSPNPPPPAGSIPKFGQCGGSGWGGAGACESGTTCQKLNDWFSQCL
ncbi:WSC domain-containing protein, variant 2 [Coprinopsis cinerea AmutBmut pab1-1]|nr:WSC domain-containing protein, variant 2 [Coprinopsis cinerea AmutBmut pab1-1]